jgi:hypothetical protein
MTQPARLGSEQVVPRQEKHCDVRWVRLFHSDRFYQAVRP